MDPFQLLKAHELEIKNRFGVRKIGVFGSYAKGTQARDSDIDILVEFNEPTFDHFMELAFYLEKLLGKKIDLVTTKGISPYISPTIEKEVVWCG